MDKDKSILFDHLEINTIPIDIEITYRTDGSVVLKSTHILEDQPYRLTDRLIHWAQVKPNSIFLAEKNINGEWIKITYKQTYTQVQKLASWLLTQPVSSTRPLLILSENSISHALLALACLHIGVPYAPVSPAYALRSRDYGKLQYVIQLLKPGLIYVSDGLNYAPALDVCAQNLTVLYGNNNLHTKFSILLNDILDFPISSKLDDSFQSITSETVAKILFTSGSSGQPKGVINTHGNISSNWQQITQTFPFLKDDLVLMDWLPWNHTFGGNHNFGLTLFHGGSLYIDNGNPTAEGISKTVENLKTISPTVYFNVPKGFEELLPYFYKDKSLCERFFSNIKMLFYAGAGMGQHVWDAWEKLSLDTTGKKTLIATGLGCTESSPSALFASQPGGYAGLLGLPVPGLQLKLVPIGNKLEARYKGPNIFPGYWNQPDLTAKSFDEEGYYCTGDALKWVDQHNPKAGFIFDGRLAEDFKLNTGTWVNAGILRSKLIKEGEGLIQDAVVIGPDRPYLTALIFLPSHLNSNDSSIIEKLLMLLIKLSQSSSGSSTLINKLLIATFSPNLDWGEITDKGSLNPKQIMLNRIEEINKLYQPEIYPEIISLSTINISNHED